MPSSSAISAIPSTGRSGEKHPRIARPRSSDCEYRGSRNDGTDQAGFSIAFGLLLGIKPPHRMNMDRHVYLQAGTFTRPQPQEEYVRSYLARAPIPTRNRVSLQ